MTFTELAFACVLHLVNGAPSEGKCDNAFFREVASSVQVEAKRFKVDKELIVGVMRFESGFDQDAKSPRGALGLMQVLRDGAADGDFAKMSDWMLTRVQLNIYLGVRYLAYARRQCKPHFLTLYNQGHGCYESGYSLGVYAAISSMKSSRIFRAVRKHLPRAPETEIPVQGSFLLASQRPVAVPQRYWP